MRILLIDDEPDILTSVKKVLTRLGHVCATYTDAELAVQAYLNEPFDVVITDCKMPRMHGNDVLKEIRTQRPLANVVMMTGFTEVDSAIESLNLGAAAYLKKPIDYEQLVGVLKNIEDQSMDVRKSAKERTLLEKELRRTQHLGSLGLMAGGIAHDFNNLLTTILGYSELLQLDCVDNPDAAEHTQMIQTAAIRARDLVRQILNFSRSEESDPVDLQLKPLVSETLNLLRPSIPLNIRVNRLFDPDTGLVRADPANLTQVLVNLCMNAIHAMETKDKGMLEIGLGNDRVTDEKAQALGLKSGGEYIRLWVSDNGIGIDDSIRPMIFKPFFTTKSVGKGTGLGLHMVDRIVRGLEGAVEVESVPGQGSVFSIYIPRRTLAYQPSSRSTSPLVEGNGSILIVDDQPEVVQLLMRIVRRLGYTVFAETDSPRALRFMETSGERIDLCIVDQNMPELTGRQLVEGIRRGHATMPILLISGSSPPDSSDERWEVLQPWSFLPKPLDMKEFSQAIHRLIRSQEGNRP